MQPQVLAPPRASSRMTGMYTDVGVQGAAASDNSSHALVGMLFEAAMGAMARARGALAQGDIVAKGQAIAKALAIVGEGLRASLNVAEGGKLARDLDQLYGYIELRLTQANLRNDAAAIEECVALLRPLHEAWQQIATQVLHPAHVPA
jgi:flagellar secretion chaperone FliS